MRAGDASARAVRANDAWERVGAKHPPAGDPSDRMRAGDASARGCVPMMRGSA